MDPTIYQCLLTLLDNLPSTEVVQQLRSSERVGGFLAMTIMLNVTKLLASYARGLCPVASPPTYRYF
jgi:hypothetical protein